MTTDTAIANLEDRKRLAYRLRTETDGMLCDADGCTRFADMAIVGDDARSDADELDVDLACHAHHDEHQVGYHVCLVPINKDVAALRNMLGR